MKPHKKVDGARDDVKQTGFHLVCSSGGSRAILGSAGAIAAIDKAGVKDFATIGGISGGSIPTVTYAAGLGAKKTLKLCIDIDFSSKLTRHGSILQILFAYFMQGRFEKTRPRHGVLSSELLGDYVNELVPTWPKGYWTMAVVGKNQILFDETGVYEIEPDGTVTVLSDKPGPLGDAVRASCAVPGIISAIPYRGRYLFDGALSPDGRCPVEIPARYYGAEHPTTIAVDVGDDNNKASKRAFKAWKLLCGKNCIPDYEDKDLTSEHGMVVILPVMDHFRSLQFTLTRDQKWVAAMAGFVDAVSALKQAKLVAPDKLAEIDSIVERYNEIVKVTKNAEDGLLSLLVEELLAKHDLF